MPHLLIEHSADLPRPAMEKLCRNLAASLGSFRTAKSEPEFPPSGTFVRAHRYETTQYGLAAQKMDFLHATLKIGAGRDKRTKREVGDALIEVLRLFVQEHHIIDQLKVSLEIQEFPMDFTWRI